MPDPIPPVLPIGGITDRMYDVIERTMEKAHKVGVSGVDELVFIRDILLAMRTSTGDMNGDVHDTLLYHVKGNELATAALVWERMIETALTELPSDILAIDDNAKSGQTSGGVD